MEYLIGVILTVAVAAFAAAIGFDRERAFYPTVLIVIASYYALFAVMGASTGTLIIESIVAGVFVLLAVLGFEGNYWLVVAALVGHGVFDFAHHFFIDNPGVPQSWPGFCLASEVHQFSTVRPRCSDSESSKPFKGLPSKACLQASQCATASMTTCSG